MAILLCVIVGLVTALLASWAARGSGYGPIADAVIGVGGALLACLSFAQLGWLPDGFLGGALFVALFGALVSLATLRGIHGTMSPPA